eukprot:g773.t1
MVTKEQLEESLNLVCGHCEVLNEELKTLKDEFEKLQGKLKRKLDTLSTPIKTEKKKFKVDEVESIEAMIEKLYREGKIEEAANCGHPKAMAELADRYLNGIDGVEKDWHKAMKWGEKAAEKNDPEGWYIVGYMMYSGKNGIKKDRKKALQYMLRSLESGQLPHEYCVYNCIGKIYLWGGNGVKEDPEEAMKWFQKIIDENRYGRRAQAYGHLAHAYHHGYGKKKDLKKARKYYEMALHSDDFLDSHQSERAWITYHYAKMLMKGLGGEKDHLKAIKWLQKSAELGDDDAIETLEKFENAWN